MQRFIIVENQALHTYLWRRTCIYTVVCILKCVFTSLWLYPGIFKPTK